MGDLIRFVDSIASSPTVRLDLNDETSWWTKTFDAPPPRLRRSMSSNAMRDGFNVGSATYDGRTLTLELECRKTTQDLAATELQKLARELDRPVNWLQYQPNGLTKPVFFRTFRSDTSQLADVMAQQAMRTFTVELLAEPFALGLRETLTTVTVNNDPAHATNGCHFSAGVPIGDVAAPGVFSLTDPVSNTLGSFMLGQRADSNGQLLCWIQAESMTLGTDTTNPGGGPDATMSGTGTNNYRSTSFATATMTTRLSTSSLTVRRGKYRVLASLKRSDSTSVMTGMVTVDSVAGQTVTIPASSVRRLVDFGLFDFRGDWSYYDGYGYLDSATDPGTSTPTISVAAARASGTGTLAWDYFVLVPADICVSAVVAGDANVVIDGVAGRVNQYGAGGLAAQPSALAGGIPDLRPGVTNKFTLIRGLDVTFLTTKTLQTVVTIYYWPRYLFVRPVST